MPSRVTNQDIYDTLLELKTDISSINMHIKGNGGKGILQRLDRAEEWISKRPISCPATSDEVFKRIRRFTSVVSAILGVLLIILALGSRMLGDTKVDNLKKQVVELNEAVKGMTP